MRSQGVDRVIYLKDKEEKKEVNWWKSMLTIPFSFEAWQIGVFIFVGWCIKNAVGYVKEQEDITDRIHLKDYVIPEVLWTTINLTVSVHCLTALEIILNKIYGYGKKLVRRILGPVQVDLGNTPPLVQQARATLVNHYRHMIPHVLEIGEQIEAQLFANLNIQNDHILQVVVRLLVLELISQGTVGINENGMYFNIPED